MSVNELTLRSQHHESRVPTKDFRVPGLSEEMHLGFADRKLQVSHFPGLESGPPPTAPFSLFIFQVASGGFVWASLCWDYRREPPRLA
jgi:hypothetical protein